jgi:hypothetical protein
MAYMEKPNFLNTPESKESIKPVYTALFIEDTPALLAKFPPKHAQIFGHHSTIAFEPASLDGIALGEKSQIKVIGRAWDEKGDALLVENAKSNNKYPHVTLSCAEGVSPVYSNQLIEEAVASNSVEYFKNPEEISVVEGYSDGEHDVVNPE